MREIRLSGSMSGRWNRGRGARRARDNRRGQQPKPPRQGQCHKDAASHHRATSRLYW
jgi:hypothetical protein